MSIALEISTYTLILTKSESLAGENVSAFYPLVNEFVSLKEHEEEFSDKRLHDYLFERSVEKELLAQEQLGFADLSLAINRYSALIQAQFQYYETEVLSSSANSIPSDCENLFVYNGQYSCDPAKVYALETDAVSDNSLLPTDRLLTVNSEAPLAILYGDLNTESFDQFHNALVSSALDGKIQYVLRYKPSSTTKGKEIIGGYGIELYVKRTDYLVIDDRNEAAESEEDEIVNAESKKNEPGSQTVLKASSDASSIDKARLKMLGNRAVGYILSQEDPFEALKHISLDFPKYAASLAELEVDADAWKEQKENIGLSHYAMGQNAILVNGAPITATFDDIYTVIENIDKERSLVYKLANLLGISNGQSASLISRNLFGEALANASDERYDYRNAGLFWLNDITKDSRHRSWTSSIKGFLNSVPGQLPAVRRNAHSFVFVIDLSAQEHISALANVIGLLRRGLPVQIGVIPQAGISAEGDEIVNELLFLQEMGADAAPYLLALLSGHDHGNAFHEISGLTSEQADFSQPQIVSKKQNWIEWFEKFDMSPDSPTVFVNGLVLDASSSNWLQHASLLMERDVEIIQSWVRNGEIDETTNVRDFFLNDALSSRDQLISPLDPLEITYTETTPIIELIKEFNLPSVDMIVDSESDEYVTLSLFVDLAKDDGLKQVILALKAINAQNEVNTRLNVIPISTPGVRDNNLEQLHLSKMLLTFDGDIESSVLKLLAAETVDPDLAARADQIDVTENVGAKVTRALVEKGLIKDVPVSNRVLINGRIVDLGTRVLSDNKVKELLDFELKNRIRPLIIGSRDVIFLNPVEDKFPLLDSFTALYSLTYLDDSANSVYTSQLPLRSTTSSWLRGNSTLCAGSEEGEAYLKIVATIDPISEKGQKYISYLETLSKFPGVSITIWLSPSIISDNLPLKRFYRACVDFKPTFNEETGDFLKKKVIFDSIPSDTLLNMDVDIPSAWIVTPAISEYDLENIILDNVKEDSLRATYQLDYILLEGHARDYTTGRAPRGLSLDLGNALAKSLTDTSVMSNWGYLQLKANPGLWYVNVKENTRSADFFELKSIGASGLNIKDDSKNVWITKMTGKVIYPFFDRKRGMENIDPLAPTSKFSPSSIWRGIKALTSGEKKSQADINIFTVASGHLYERFLSIMTASVMKHTNHTVKFWLIENFLSPSFKEFLPFLADKYGFEYELVTYKWPSWLRAQTEKQRTIWGYKILFLDVLFPQSLENVIFVDADQIVRTDLYDLVKLDLHGAPYGYTPMGDSRDEMEGFRFWKQGYWKDFLRGKPYHISALYVIDLVRFRELQAGDRLRQHYQQLSQDPGSLSNLDQDLPNHLQHSLPIFSLPDEWLWCETWCSDESLKTAKTIDLCNNPLTKEPKLDRARRQIPEWTVYDDEIRELASRVSQIQEDVVRSATTETSSLQEVEDDDVHDEL